ncbi:hypothetical protein HQ590_15395 [bacterium]|nr:hypothetical protein [bacterium]
MSQYRDPENHYVLEHPEGWLPLTHEGSAHVSLASLTTGGYLRVEAYEFTHPNPESLRPANSLRALLDCEKRNFSLTAEPQITRGNRSGMTMAVTSFRRQRVAGAAPGTDFDYGRGWVFTRGQTQVRCLYRCRASDAGTDDDELEQIIDSLRIQETAHLDAPSFTKYYYSLLKRWRPQLAVQPPEGLTLTLADGQTILLEHLYNHYLLEPERMEELIESHLQRLDYCGDDVPNLANYQAIRSLLFPKILPLNSARGLPPHRLPFWNGLSIGAVVQGRVFTYGVNMERLRTWQKQSLADIMDQLMDNLYATPPVAPRGLLNSEGVAQAISYVDHPFSASFVLFEDFYETTSHNLGAKEFLVGLPDPSCVSCYRDDDPRFVVQHTALLRFDYHRSVERLTDTIYLVTGPRPQDATPYDILHCCVKKS